MDVNNKPYTHNHNTIARRSFDPRRDIVFCPDSQWQDFLWKVINVFCVLSTAHSDRNFDRNHLIRHVALSQQRFTDSEPAPLSRLFHGGLELWCRNLYIVVDAPAALREFVAERPVKPNWALEVLDDSPGATCLRSGGWQIIEGSWLQGGPAYESAKKLLGQVTEYNFLEEEVTEWILDTFPVELEIRFARAIRR